MHKMSLNTISQKHKVSFGTLPAVEGEQQLQS